MKLSGQVLRYINYLMLNLHNFDNLGLLYGRMGGVIFFKELSRRTAISHFSDYADSLLDSIYDEINFSMTIDLGSGLAGIGWGIEYLIQNQYLEGNSDEILEEIDQIMVNTPLYEDKSLATGNLGIIYYILARVESFDRTTPLSIFSKEYLNELGCFFMTDHFCLPPAGIILQRFIDSLKGTVNYEMKPKIDELFFEDLPTIKLSPLKYDLSLSRGIIGILYKQILL